MTIKRGKDLEGENEKKKKSGGQSLYIQPDFLAATNIVERGHLEYI